MTTSDAATAVGCARRPFIARFATSIPVQEVRPLRYDRARQVSLVFENGEWIDAVTARASVSDTRMTKVHQETTDDE